MGMIIRQKSATMSGRSVEQLTARQEGNTFVQFSVTINILFGLIIILSNFKICNFKFPVLNWSA